MRSMPGPVSDSYDPEFSTGANAGDVADAIRAVVKRIEARELLGKPVKNIVEVVHGPQGRLFQGETLSEREWRIIRFSLNRALETI